MAIMTLLALGLVACASTSVSPAGHSASGASPDAVTATPSGSARSTPAGFTTLSGVIVEGIRSTCRVLDTGVRRYALVGPGVDPLREGDRVHVVGQSRPELVNPCGTTFSVSDVQRL
jgi:hypothetical protein